jgi:hypothetical protein
MHKSNDFSKPCGWWDCLPAHESFTVNNILIKSLTFISIIGKFNPKDKRLVTSTNKLSKQYNKVEEWMRKKSKIIRRTEGKE